MPSSEPPDSARTPTATAGAASTAATDAASPTVTPVEDVILPAARTEDGAGLHVLRKRGGAIELGTLRASREGQPIHGELVALRPREGSPLIDVQVLHDARPPATGRPAKVATAAFRAGWDRIFGAELGEGDVIEGELASSLEPSPDEEANPDGEAN